MGRPYHHGNLKDALVAAAIDLIGEEGPQAFHLRAVARKAGVSSAAPYRHFRDKTALLEAVASEVARRLVAKTEAELARAGDSPIEQMRAQGVAFIKFAVAHPAHFRVMNLPEVAKTFDEHLKARTGGRDLLREVIEELKLDVDADAVRLTAQASIYGLARLIVDGHFGEHPPTEEEAEALALTVTGVIGVGILPR